MDNKFNCMQCGVKGCEKEDGTFPTGCLTSVAMDDDLVEESVAEFRDNPEILEFATSAAKIEGNYYCEATRAEEVVHLCRLMGYQKIGLACCGGLANEGKAFAKILESNGLTPYGVICKVGNKDKSCLDMKEEDKVRPGGFEPMCNPILQAKLLNKEKTDFNVIIGLCVGHDSLFNRYSDAMATTLVAKDRVLGHNPVAALTNLEGYYRKLKQIKK